jgi:hypothetical protein
MCICICTMCICICTMCIVSVSINPQIGDNWASEDFEYKREISEKEKKKRGFRGPRAWATNIVCRSEKCVYPNGSAPVFRFKAREITFSGLITLRSSEIRVRLGRPYTRGWNKSSRYDKLSQIFHNNWWNKTTGLTAESFPFRRTSLYVFRKRKTNFFFDPLPCRNSICIFEYLSISSI